MPLKSLKSRIKIPEKLRKNRKLKRLTSLKKERSYRTEIDQIFREIRLRREMAGNERYAIMGVGNDLKGDDGVGWHVVDILRREFGKDPNILFIKTSSPENHVGEILGFAPKLLIIVDAADFKKSPGAIKIIKEYQIMDSFITTHTTPLTVFLRLYQKDAEERRAVTIIGIQRKDNEFGQPMSQPVRKSGDNVARIISMLYRKNFLDISIERELEYISNPFKKITDYFRGKRAGGRGA